MAEAHRFRTVVEPARGGGAVAPVPADVAAAIGGLKQMHISGTVNGVPYQSSTMPWQGRQLYMGVHKATRQAAGVEIGDEIEVELARDDRPRVLELAPELKSALAAEPELRARFEALSFSRRREIAEPVSEAKKPATRAARLDRALARLRELSA